MKLKTRKRIRLFGKLLFIVYVVLLLYFLLFSEMYGRTGPRMEYAYNLELFKEIKRFWTYRDILGPYVVFGNLAGNVLIFIPFGFFLPMASRYRRMFTTLIYSIFLSLSVETVQLFTRIGSFDVDDILLNTIGGCLGYIIYALCCYTRRNYVKKKTEKS